MRFQNSHLLTQLTTFGDGAEQKPLSFSFLLFLETWYGGERSRVRDQKVLSLGCLPLPSSDGGRARVGAASVMTPAGKSQPAF